MKLVFVGTVIFLLFSQATGQVSFDFVKASGPNGKTVNHIDERFYGTYDSDSSARYVFDKQGIQVVSTVTNSISKSLIRESTKYTLKNGYIFGVVAGDSLPYFEENDRIYFGFRNKTLLLGTDNGNELQQLDANTYLLFFKENGYYTPMLFKFKGNNLLISDFDYAPDEWSLLQVQNKTTDLFQGLTVYHLEPTSQEWQAIFQSAFQVSRILSKE